MYPYPSGPAHQGHVRNYTFGDLFVRYRTMQGFAVLSPFGFDFFGLPAENAAIETGTHPRIFTEARIAELKESLFRLGAVYDWRREIVSHDPEYMRWNQVIFLRFMEAGLAYRANAPVNWCPGCQTVLANEQVLADGRCERSGDLVEKRDLEQWFFRITSYADELLAAIDTLEWPERVKVMQRNWIGRSEGAEFDLVVANPDASPSDVAIRVFTTRPDTSFGMTFAVIAPEHPLFDRLATDEHRAAVEELASRARVSTEIERLRAGETGEELDKRGAVHRQLRHQPVQRRAGPALRRRLRPHGLRHRGDHGRPGRGRARLAPSPSPTGCRSSARSSRRPLRGRRVHRVPARRSTAGSSTASTSPPPRSGPSSGWRSQGIGTRRVNYRLRDWLVSRQRYWGCPIPVVYCPDDGIVGVPEDDLPVLAPDDVEFLPSGQSPLALHEGFAATTCPKCGGPARRETDTMDTFVDSSWYFLRFCNPWYGEGPVDGRSRATLDAGRRVHRRHRARDLAPALRPLLPAGPDRHRGSSPRSNASRSGTTSPRA